MERINYDQRQELFRVPGMKLLQQGEEPCALSGGQSTGSAGFRQTIPYEDRQITDYTTEGRVTFSQHSFRMNVHECQGAGADVILAELTIWRE